MKDRSKISRQSVLPPKVRGVIGRARSHQFGPTDHERARSFRIGLHQAILQSRDRISPVSYSQTFKAISEATAPEHQRFLQYPVDDEYVRLLIEVKPLDIDQEVLWLASRLAVHWESLSHHVELRKKIGDGVVREDWSSVISQLETHEQIFGKSLWSVALRISALQESEGDDSRKEYVKLIRSRTRKGVLPFFAMLVSQRAASSTSIGWYLDDASRRLARAASSDLSNYLRYKLLNAWPKTADGCGAVLRMEQNHNTVDQYETFIGFLQKAAGSIKDEKLSREVSRAVDLLIQVGDPRITKLARSIDREDVPSHKILPTCVHDFPFAEANRQEVIGSYLSLTKSGAAFYDIVAAAILKSSTIESRGKRICTAQGRRQKLIHGLSSAFSRRSYPPGSSYISDVEWTKKFAHIFEGVEIGSSIRHLIGACFHPDLNEARRYLRVAALSTNDDGIFDLLTEPSDKAYQVLRSAFSGTATLEFCDVARSWNDGTAPRLNKDARSLAAALRPVFGKSSYLSKVPTLVQGAESDITKRISALVMITQHAKQGNIWEASRLAADEFVVWGVDASSLPIREIFDGVVWNDLKDASQKVELSNAMSALPQKYQDERMRSYRRFALESCLCSLKIDRPSELRFVTEHIPTEHLVYFLSVGCSQAMLDMLPFIQGTRQVLEERRAICGYLVTLDSLKAAEYEDEILAISRELAVLDGLETFDGSRVHVDMDALAQLLKRDLAEGFSRYASLVEENTDASEEFDLVLKEILRRDIQARLLISMPVSEADELLISLIWRARDRFLFNVPHGLDSYLSKRIRHGSIVGFIRSPGESEGVIAQRSEIGEYGIDGSWSENVADIAQRIRLHELVSAFSRSIDDRLILLRDVLIHVRSEDKPRGMLDARLSPPEYHLIRSVASKDRSLDDFIATILLSLRGLLGPSLLQVRDYIGRDLLRFVSEQFELLRSRARDVLPNPDERAAFDGAAGRASVAMQAAVQSASLWFDPVDMKPHTFTIEEVIDIAIASVAAISNGFKPAISISKTTTFGISEQALPILMDALFPAFGNVAEHSQCGESPVVNISVVHDQGRGMLTLKIENEFKNVLHTHEELQANLAARREDLNEIGQAYRVRQDKGSGIHKMNSTVRASGNGVFEFGADERYFHVFFELPFSPDRLVEL